MTDTSVLVVRPRRITIYGSVAAAVIVASMITLIVLLAADLEAENFRLFDRLGLMSIGVAAAGGIMLVARPRVRADADGMAVRNVLGETYFPWEVVIRIAFPAGSHWAQVVLEDDETHPLLAIQAMDKQRAVTALRALRALQEEHAPERPALSPEAVERTRRRLQAEAAAAAARPLGRLEVIDREMAAKPPRRKRRRQQK